MVLVPASLGLVRNTPDTKEAFLLVSLSHRIIMTMMIMIMLIMMDFHDNDDVDDDVEDESKKRKVSRILYWPSLNLPLIGQSLLSSF